MEVKDALKLKFGDPVWVTYNPTPGHGEPIDGPGKVISAGTEISKNLKGTEYTWVTVKYNGVSRSVFPSWCLAHLNKGGSK